MTTRRFRHGELGFSLELRPDTTVLMEVPPVIALASDSSFRPVMVIAAETTPSETLLDAWVDGALAAQAATLSDVQLLDRRETPLARLPAIRTLSHHATEVDAVALEQWWVLGEERGWALAASCAALDYDALADCFCQMADSFHPLPQDGE